MHCKARGNCGSGRLDRRQARCGEGGAVQTLQSTCETIASDRRAEIPLPSPHPTHLSLGSWDATTDGRWMKDSAASWNALMPLMALRAAMAGAAEPWRVTWSVLCWGVQLVSSSCTGESHGPAACPCPPSEHYGEPGHQDQDTDHANVSSCWLTTARHNLHPFTSPPPPQAHPFNPQIRSPTPLASQPHTNLHHLSFPLPFAVMCL